MLGCSVFLGYWKKEELEKHLLDMKKIGVEGVFTSLHITEDDKSKHWESLLDLATCTKQHGMELTIDISPTALHHLPLGSAPYKTLQHIGVTRLRLDYGISEKQIVSISREIPIALNASTVSETEWLRLVKLGILKGRVEAWHNYYPKPETGLDRTYFRNQNEMWESYNIPVLSFVSGDGELRAPLHKGLPTLEDHRNISPLLQRLDLEKEGVDHIYIGDHNLSHSSYLQWESYHDGVIPLRYIATNKQTTYKPFVERIHNNRPDVARDVIRAEESRGLEWKESMWEGLQEKPRKKGSVTVDTLTRYKGEVQIAKTTLPQNEGVVEIGNVIAEDIPIIDYIGSSQKFKLEEVKGEGKDE